MTRPRKPTDRGLARERTVLAWYRLGLAAVVCIAVLLRHAWPLHGTDQVVALALIGAAAIVWAVALLTSTRSGGKPDEDVPVGGRALWMITAGTLVLAALAFVLAVLPPP